MMRTGSIEEACPEHRVIARAIDPSAECPSIPLWTGAPLFDVATPWLGSHAFHLSDASNLLCLYTMEPGVSAVVAQANLDIAVDGSMVGGGGGTEPVLDAVTSDCEGIQPQTQAPFEGPDPTPVPPLQIDPVNVSILADALGPDLRAIFHEQVAWVPPTTVPLGGSPVTIAVVDTLPTTGATDPNSEHGPSLVRIIDDLLCEPGALCDFHVLPILGLPRTRDGLDVVDGGYVGSFKDLAGGIVEAVERWKATPNSGPLVINLSVGWESDPFGGVAVEPKPTVDGVLVALEYASCHGALIVAAAGNDNGLCSDGPLFPAAWEQRPAPNAARCAALGVAGSQHPTDPTAVYHPLVHAVGGLHVRFESMPGSRPLATPRLVADGTYVVAGSGDDLTAGHTGTSISTGVVAGVAAAVWSRDPLRPSWEVAQLVYESGQDLVIDAQFGLVGHDPEPMRRVGMCQALDLAITTQSFPCSWEPAADLAPIVLAATTVDPTPIAAISDFQFEEDCSCDPAVASCGPVCEASAVTAHGPFANMCGLTTFDPTAPFVSPQPNDPACPTCTLTDEEVEASLHRFYEGEAIEWIAVEVSDGVTSERYVFENVSLSPYDVTTLTLGSEVLQMNVLKASISTKFASYSYAIVDELIIE